MHKEAAMKRYLTIAFAILILAVPVWAVTPNTGNDNGNGWLGLYTQTIDQDLKEAFNLATDHGVVINRVIPDSPADKAGLKAGDILLSLNGTDLNTSEQLADLVGEHNSGDYVKLDIMHKGKEETLSVELGERQDNQGRMLNNPMGMSPAPHVFSKVYRFNQSEVADTYIGVSLQSLNSQLGDYFGVANGKGALVWDVMDDSPAQKAGLKAGDVITSIDGQAVDGPSDVQKAVRDKKKGDKLEMTVLRNKNKMDFALEVGETPPDYLSNLGNISPDMDQYFNMNMPKMRGLLHGNIGNSFMDLDSMQQSIQQLQEQMQKLQEQLNQMQPSPKK
jgi:serine protease Do